MDGPKIDLYEPPFWCALAFGILVLVPLTRPGLRKWAQAAVNLSFLWLILDNYSLFVICVGVVIVWFSLHVIQRRWLGLLPVLLGCLTVLGLFVLHKAPNLAPALNLAYPAMILGVIGFSYVALRLIDAGRLVYEGQAFAPDLPSTINYFLPFHMLAAGPIQSYAEFVALPGVPAPLRVSEALTATERIAPGLFKKYVLASAVSHVFLTGFRAPMPYMLLEANFFYLWVYLDFSAYSDIAVGVGQLLGVATPENFNKPYGARNMIDYWERWHMSLSLFIRRNLFIPIQLFLVRRTGGRAALFCASVAFTVSFVLCGLWHGVQLPWFLWGCLQALGLVVVNIYRELLTRKLGRQGVKQYLARPGVRLVAILLTQEFVAFTLLVAGYPWA